MEIDILYEGAYPMAKVGLTAGEVITTESGAMVAMTPGLEIKGKAKGGLLKSLGRKLLSGESFFQSQVEAKQDGEVLLAPNMPGDMRVLDIGAGWRLEKGAFVACGPHGEISTKAQGLGKGLFGGEGFFVIEASGQGPILVSAYGAIHTVELAEGQEYVVDNGHLVAWNCDYKIGKAASGWMSTMTSGEGLVCRFTGPGTVHMQSRNLSPLARAVAALIPSGN